MKKLVNKNPRELSFTILETIVAVGLLMAFTLEMAGGQGNVVNKVEYARRSNDAIWLAKRIMSQVEYNYQTMELKELETTTSVKDEKFQKIDGETDFDYTYSVEIKEWKFPIFDFLLNGGVPPSDEEEDNESTPEAKPEDGGIPGLDAILKQIFKGHILKIAHVEVSWPDGARRDSVSLTYLLANNKALDEYLATKKGVFDGVLKKMAGTPPGGVSQQDPPGSVPQQDGSVLWPNGTRRLPDGTQILSDGQVIPPPQVQPPGNPGGIVAPNPTPNSQPGGGGSPPSPPANANPTP